MWEVGGQMGEEEVLGVWLDPGEPADDPDLPRHLEAMERGGESR